jgi:hypothetical protein
MTQLEEDIISGSNVARIGMKLEVVIPVAEVDRAETASASVNDLASALRRAASAHSEHEKRIGQHDANWPDWYAAYMVAEHAGQELPQ